MIDEDPKVAEVMGYGKKEHHDIDQQSGIKLNGWDSRDKGLR